MDFSHTRKLTSIKWAVHEMRNIPTLRQPLSCRGISFPLIRSTLVCRSSVINLNKFPRVNFIVRSCVKFERIETLFVPNEVRKDFYCYSLDLGGRSGLAQSKSVDHSPFSLIILK